MSLVRDELLAVLRCPVTKSSLVLQEEALVTTVAGPDGRNLRYSIEDGILLLLRPEQLSAASAAGSDQHDGGTAVGSPPPVVPTSDAVAAPVVAGSDPASPAVVGSDPAGRASDSRGDAPASPRPDVS